MASGLIYFEYNQRLERYADMRHVMWREKSHTPNLHHMTILGRKWKMQAQFVESFIYLHF